MLSIKEIIEVRKKPKMKLVWGYYWLWGMDIMRERKRKGVRPLCGPFSEYSEKGADYGNYKIEN